MPAPNVTPPPRLVLLLSSLAWISVAVASVAAFDRWSPAYGLRAATFVGLDWTGPPVDSAIEASLSSEFLVSRPRRELQTYSVEWNGYLVVEEPGLYTFKLTSDDGSTLELDGLNAVDNDGVHGPRAVTGQRDLAQGVHAIRLRYFQAGDRLTLGVLWARDGVTFTPIPERVLLPDAWTYARYRWRWLPPVTAGLLTGLSGVAILLFVGSKDRQAATARSATGGVLGLLERPLVACALIAAVGLPLRFVLLRSSPAVLWPDSIVFYTTMREILGGAWVSHDAYRTFFYPYLLAAVFADARTPDNGARLIAIQQAMGLASSLMFYWIGRRAFSPLVALAGALLCASHALQLFYEINVMTESLFTFVLALSLCAAVRAYDSPTIARAAVLGLAAAALVLVRPVAQWFILCVAIAGYVAARGRPRLGAASALAVCYLLPVLLWMGVNQREYGFFGVALGRGMGLYTRVFDIDRMTPNDDTRHPEMRALWAFAESQQWHPNRVRDELNYARHHTAAMADDAMYGIALETALAHPVRFGLNTLRQWAGQIAAARVSVHTCVSGVGPYLCSARSEGDSLPPFPNAPAEPSRLRQWAVRYVTGAQAPMRVVAVFALVGLFAYLPRFLVNPAGLLCAGTIAYLTLVPALALRPEDRFRLPVDALLFMFAVWGVRALVMRRPLTRELAPLSTS